MEPLDQEVDESELELPSDPMQLMMGPSHPAMHGTVRIAVELSGEVVVKADVQIGYLHRGFEKSCERGTWTQVFPYVDRCNYSSPMLNNVGYALAVEKLCGLQVPDRCQYYRVILGELARIADHLVCNAAMAMELGAFTPFLWWTRAREMIYDLFEEETGARVTHSFGRIGGMAQPPTDNFKEHVLAILDRVVASSDEGISLLETNRIFMDRTMGVSGHQRRGRHRAWMDGSMSAFDGRALRYPQGAPLPRVRPLRLRCPGWTRRRQLRPLDGPQ